MSRARSTLAASLVLLVLLAAAPRPAAAQIQTFGPQVYPGRMEVSVHLGAQSALSTYGKSGSPPGGLRLMGDFNLRLMDAGIWTLWFNAGIALTVGFPCSAGLGGVYGCGGYGSGSEIEPMAGIKIKFKPAIPLVPYVRADLFYSFIFDRYCNDTGHAVGARIGGGAKYFLTRKIGVGVELGASFGPAFYAGAPADKCGVAFQYGAHTDVYVAIDYLVGAEFAF